MKYSERYLYLFFCVVAVVVGADIFLKLITKKSAFLFFYTQKKFVSGIKEAYNCMKHII